MQILNLSRVQYPGPQLVSITRGQVFPRLDEKDSFKVRFSGVPTTSFGPDPVERTMIQTLAGETVKVAWREYGNPNAEQVVVAVHGLTRNGWDFDRLARQLVGSNYRVICPDIVGRGNSSWFTYPYGFLMPTLKYDIPTYVQQMENLFEHLSLKNKKITWIGTSMGGLIGIKIAAQGQVPIHRLILNDVGPRISLQAFQHLTRQMEEDARATFKDLDEAKTYFQKRFREFGPMDGAAWDELTRHSVRWNSRESCYRLNYDTLISGSGLWLQAFMRMIPPLLRQMSGFNIESDWEKIQIPTLVLRGEHSAILPRDVAQRMASRKLVSLVEVPQAGHAPSLMIPSHIQLIQDWLSIAPGS